MLFYVMVLLVVTLLRLHKAPAVNFHFHVLVVVHGDHRSVAATVTVAVISDMAAGADGVVDGDVVADVDAVGMLAKALQLDQVRHLPFPERVGQGGSAVDTGHVKRSRPVVLEVVMMLEVVDMTVVRVEFCMGVTQRTFRVKVESWVGNALFRVRVIRLYHENQVSRKAHKILQK